MPTPTRSDHRFSYDDFVRWPDDGRRHEIVDGAHYVTPSPTTRHQVLVGRIFFAIEQHLRAHVGAGRVFVSPFDVVFSPWDVVEPDVLFVASDQLDILTDVNVRGAPALIVEVLSPGTRTRDETVKRRLFEQGGVREYWVVDPDVNLVRIFRRGSGRALEEVAALGANLDDVVTTPLLPGLSLPLSELFAPS